MQLCKVKFNLKSSTNLAKIKKHGEFLEKVGLEICYVQSTRRKQKRVEDNQILYLLSNITSLIRIPLSKINSCCKIQNLSNKLARNI